MDESEFNVVKMGKKACVVHMTLPDGYEFVEASLCVDPENYDEEVGVRIAKERLKTKVWNVLGYAAHLNALPADALSD
jgi:hypothetical protein